MRDLALRQFSIRTEISLICKAVQSHAQIGLSSLYDFSLFKFDFFLYLSCFSNFWSLIFFKFFHYCSFVFTHVHSCMCTFSHDLSNMLTMPDVATRTHRGPISTSLPGKALESGWGMGLFCYHFIGKLVFLTLCRLGNHKIDLWLVL